MVSGEACLFLDIVLSCLDGDIRLGMLFLDIVLSCLGGDIS